MVAQFKYTVLIMPSGANLVTGLPFAVEKFQSEYAIPDGELKVQYNCHPFVALGAFDLARQSACTMFS